MVDIKERATRLVAVALIIALLSSITIVIASARESLYIKSYSANMTTGSNGKVTASLSITGFSKMDEIGSTKIEIYENNKLVKTYNSSSTSGMMGSDKALHTGTVTYTGVKGRTYKAIVTFKCGKGGGYDNRSATTTSVTAK